MLKKLFNRDLIINDISSNKSFSIGTYVILFVVAVVMTLLNIKTQKGALTYATGIFAACCVINLVLTIVKSIPEIVPKFLFAAEVLIMFTFFLVSGNPDGFSAIWICMLPSLGMLLFNRKWGTIICSFMFCVLAFLLWLPYGQQFLQYPYNETFKMRFPVLFLAFHLLAFLLETLRINANNQITTLKEHYKELSMFDQLTKLYNRQGMYTTIEKDEKFLSADKIGVAMFDIDDFKGVNDKYGHEIGDVVLREFSDILINNLSVPICRWGGEEFVAVFTGADLENLDFENIRKLIEKNRIKVKNGDFSVTASIGISIKDNFDVKNIDLLISEADSALYTAKNSGKNKLEYYK